MLIDTNRSNSSINRIAVKRYSSDDSGEMERNGKRTIQINVRLSTQDFDLINRAAATLWPDAELSRSGILLGLDGNDVSIEIEGVALSIPFASIAEAKLVLTDKLIQEDLKTRARASQDQDTD